jgi:quercetin dioxygenase-like cupin family protein
VEVRRWHEEPVEQLSEGIGRQVLDTDGLTVARIHLAMGAHVPRHAHPNEQIANVVSGRLRFVVGGEEAIVGAGESIAIPPDVPHEVEALEAALVIDVFTPRRDDWRRGDDGYLRG